MSVERTSEDGDLRGSIREEPGRAALQALARALGRQTARQIWAEAIRGDSTVASMDGAAPKQARRKSGARRAAR